MACHHFTCSANSVFQKTVVNKARNKQNNTLNSTSYIFTGSWCTLFIAMAPRPRLGWCLLNLSHAQFHEHDSWYIIPQPMSRWIEREEDCFYSQVNWQHQDLIAQSGSGGRDCKGIKNIWKCKDHTCIGLGHWCTGASSPASLTSP